MKGPLANSMLLRIRSNPWLDPELEDVEVASFDVPSLVAFLESLDGTAYGDEAPKSFPQ